MKIKKITLNVLWILILLFVFGGMPQKLLAQTERNCIPFAKGSALVVFVNGCPVIDNNLNKIKFFSNNSCQGPGHGPERIRPQPNSERANFGSDPACPWHAITKKKNPWWNVFYYNGQVQCDCYEFAAPYPWTCTPAQLANPPSYCQ